MRTNRTSRAARALTLLIALALAALLVAPTGAVAATRTSVTGWSTVAATVAPATEVRRSVTVLTGGRAVERRVLLQLRPSGSLTWQTLASTHTDARGLATLVASAVPRSGWLRAKVPATRTAAGAVTARQPVTVTTATDPLTDPLTDPPTDPAGTPTAFEAEVLRLTNELRARGTTCGTTTYGPKAPVQLSAELTKASRAYAVRMGEERFFAHVSPTGDDPGDRASAAGYAWRGYGENIAAGYSTPAKVVEGWHTSVGHCHNLMGAFVHLGVGHAQVSGSEYGHYWVQMFGNPR